MCLVFLAASCTPPGKAAAQHRILVFSKTKGYYHQSIPDGIAAIMTLGRENNFMVDTTKDATLFTPENLKRYKAVVFLSTTGDVLDDPQQQALTEYVRGGGGFAGIHAAADTEYDWPWYGRLVGAYFQSHPATQQATLQVVDASHAATKHLPATWTRTDEWYNFKNLSDSVHVLMTIDESTYTGVRMGVVHPVSWYRSFEGGRTFYTALGHTSESYREGLFLQHLLGGIRYAMGIEGK